MLGDIIFVLVTDRTKYIFGFERFKSAKEETEGKTLPSWLTTNSGALLSCVLRYSCTIKRPQLLIYLYTPLIQD